MKYLYKMGETETYIYDEVVNGLADNNGGVLTLDQIKYAIHQLQKEGMKYFHIIDEFCLLLYFIERENVDKAIVIEKRDEF